MYIIKWFVGHQNTGVECRSTPVQAWAHRKPWAHRQAWGKSAHSGFRHAVKLKVFICSISTKHYTLICTIPKFSWEFYASKLTSKLDLRFDLNSETCFKFCRWHTLSKYQRFQSIRQTGGIRMVENLPASQISTIVRRLNAQSWY